MGRVKVRVPLEVGVGEGEGDLDLGLDLVFIGLLMAFFCFAAWAALALFFASSAPAV